MIWGSLGQANDSSIELSSAEKEKKSIDTKDISTSSQFGLTLIDFIWLSSPLTDFWLR